MKKNLLYVFMTLATLLFTACEQNQLDNTQNTISCTPSDTVIAAEGGEFVVAISSSNAWSATTNQKWITISPTSGQGDAYVTIQVAAGEQAEAKVLFTTGENTAKLTITRGEKQSSDDEEDPSNPNDGKTYPYLTIYDLMPLHLIPLADAESKLMDMGYTAEGVQYHEPLYCYQYTTTNIDTITLLTSVQDGIIEDVHYTASKGINPQAAKEWLMHIPESVTLPVQNQAVEFSFGYAFNDNFDEEVYHYGDWIDLVRDHSYDNIQIGGYWENEAGIETCEHVVSIDYIYQNNTDMVYFGISQIREAMEPGEPDEPTPSEGIGIFSVSADKQVTFSKGNLQYTQSTNTWSFASAQYEMIGTDNVTGGTVSSDPKYGDEKHGDALADKVDLFGWSTGANNFGVSTSTDYDDYSGSFVDWGTNKIGNDAPNTWRTLTEDEWDYVVFNRPNASSLKGVARVNGVNGLILLPDNWTCPSGVSFKSGFHSEWGVDYYADYQTFTAAEWSLLEAAGAIFLPAAGARDGSYVTDVQRGGYYWSATEGYSSGAYYLSFYLAEAGLGSQGRANGLSVRLVKDL